MKRIFVLFAMTLLLTSCAPEIPEESEPSEENLEVISFDSTYVYGESRDPIKPVIHLDTEKGVYSFCYSGFSSYMPVGEYELTDSKLILYDGDGSYVFHVTDEGYVFDAESSIAIPTYRVSGDSDERYSPVPDGALFKKEGSEPYGVTEYGGYVKRIASDERIKMSETDADDVANIVFGLEWQDGPTDCIFDCQIDINGFLVKYHSSCGALNHITPSYLSHVDPEQKYSYCVLDDEKQRELNEIIAKYVDLGEDIVRD